MESNFNDIRKAIIKDINTHFEYAEKEGLFSKKFDADDIYYDIRCDSFLIAIHILISNQIHWFLKLSFDYKKTILIKMM